MTRTNEAIEKSCAARAICSQKGRLCAPTCVAYSELISQIRASGIPRRYYDISGAPASTATATALIRGENPNVADFVSGWGGDLFDNISSGRGLYLYGPTTGTGKTTVATAIGLSYIRARVSKALSERSALRAPVVLYVHMPAFLRTVKAIYEADTNVAQTASESVSGVSRRMVDVDLLIVDDIGAESPTEPIRERLLAIFDSRWSEARSTIFTSNKSLQELELSLGARIRSRIEGCTTALPFGGRDHRRKGGVS